jgi:peptidoglycan/LPS O-acetylase OafA/YrhL
MFAIVISNVATHSIGDLTLQNFFYKSPFNQLCFFILGVEVSKHNLRGMISVLLAWIPYVVAVLITGVMLGYPAMRLSPLLTPLLMVPIILLYNLTRLSVRYMRSECHLKSESLWIRLITETASCSYTAYFLHFIIIDITANTFPHVFRSELYIIFIIVVTLVLSRILRPLTEDTFVALGRQIERAAFH